MMFMVLPLCLSPPVRLFRIRLLPALRCRLRSAREGTNYRRERMLDCSPAMMSGVHLRGRPLTPALSPEYRGEGAKIRRLSPEYQGEGAKFRTLIR
jgi:hypothetical protein